MPFSRLFTEHIDQEQEKHHQYFQQTRCCSRTHYEVLGVDKSATGKEIRQSFIKLSKKLHPDINKDPKNHDKFIKINEAYSTLIKPSERMDYDRTLASEVWAKQHEGSHTSSSSSRSGYEYEAGSDEGQFYYDETLWHWKNQAAADKHGFRGANRISNGKIVLGCFALIFFGGVLPYYSFYKTRTKRLENVDDIPDVCKIP
ncbi:dnaJ-like protein 60 [Gigantopelta aegis]|uniref:dnaJ-like protein 60 n=1 Tax=Gigantopelta aegis TaxID=1735272 RepID=UPI001B88C345|nr:dnaJ-like protein 60 [Gigantopelta aegis]